VISSPDAAGRSSTTASAGSPALSRARDILARYPIIDGHNDLPFAMRLLNDYDLDGYPIDVEQGRTYTDLVRLRAGGVGGQFWSVYVPCNASRSG
jgi:membrane dipeptidase